MKESDIQRTILDGLAACKIFAFRLNTGGTKIAGGYFRAHTLGKGAADILAFPLQLASGVLWIEVKTAKGILSPEQLSFHKRVREYGHDYLVARDWNDVKTWLAV